jgi:hypothetical protein
MKRLLRTLYTLRGLILAGTLALAATGSYLDRGTASSLTQVHSHLGSHMQDPDGRQVQPLSLYAACWQPGYSYMSLCPLWH